MAWCSVKENTGTTLPLPLPPACLCRIWRLGSQSSINKNNESTTTPNNRMKHC